MENLQQTRRQTWQPIFGLNKGYGAHRRYIGLLSVRQKKKQGVLVPNASPRT
jgi:hypothetical protein